jgi:hypothetical protein
MLCFFGDFLEMDIKKDRFFKLLNDMQVLCFFHAARLFFCAMR